MSVTVLDGFDDLAALFTVWANDIEDGSYEARMLELVPLIQSCETEAFLGGHTPGGEPWTPLAPSTIYAKGNRSGIVGPHTQILVDTGRLFESLTQIPFSEDTYCDWGDDWLTFGTSVPYAIFHETGTTRMPARPAVGINDRTADQIADAVGGFAVDKIAGA